MNLDLEFVRSRFPGLGGDWVLFDNAGGSQVLTAVVDRVSDYLLHTNVQHGASYTPSVQAGARVRQGRDEMALLVNAERSEEIVMGSSTTQLLRQLSQAMRFEPGDEIIVTNFDHEANIGPWMALRERGVVVKTWHLDDTSLDARMDDLRGLFTDRTRLLCVTHASNVVGAINPVADLAALAHEHGARICVDGVAFAPHGLIDVRAWDIDYYAFSLYKVYGPHQALLYGKYECLESLASLNHYFLGEDDIPYKLQPGNVNYELTYGCGAVTEYLEDLGRHHSGADLSGRAAMIAAFEAISAQEEALSERLLGYLRAKNHVRLIGPSTSSRDVRVPTISFIVDGRDSEEIIQRVDPHMIGIRFGDFYARRLIEDLSLSAHNGVVRVSMVHYNTVEEVDRLTSVLDTVLQ